MKKNVLIFLLSFGLFQANAQTPCMASITHTVSGATVTFNTVVTGGTAPYTYSYNYDDGNTGTRNVHTYTTTNIYSPCVTVTDVNNLSCIACDSFFLNLTPCIINPAFTETVTGLNVNFTDNSAVTNGTIISRSWTFGDGGTSNLTAPSHAYTTAGTYNVVLVVDGTDASNFCTDSISKMITVGPSDIKDATRSELKIYPNPTTNMVVIEIPTGKSLKDLTVTDVTGRRIMDKPIQVENNLLTISLKNQAPGIYFVKLQTNDQLYTASIMKQD